MSLMALQAKPIKRRPFIKPQVSVGAINRKPKQNAEQTILAKETEKSTSPDATEIPDKTVDSLNNLKEKQPILKHTFSAGQEATLDEVHLTSQSGVTEYEVSSDKGIKRLLPQTSNTHSDSEYPPPPPSPSKINRSRIKAIPRLAYRKTSFSASESEDESKRHYNRHRNNSNTP